MRYIGNGGGGGIGGHATTSQWAKGTEGEVGGVIAFPCSMPLPIQVEETKEGSMPLCPLQQPIGGTS